MIFVIITMLSNINSRIDIFYIDFLLMKNNLSRNLDNYKLF